MNARGKGAVDPTARLLSLALAGGLPLACFIATASPTGYWHDGGEFIAQAASIGISHPPGHPLAGLVHALLAFVPLGPLPLRIALASSVMASIAACFLYLAIERTVRAQGIASNRIAMPLSLGATWLVVGSVGFWFQAVRPEVYALQAALSCLVIERIVALEVSWPTYDIRPAYVACFALGLSLANHHFLGLLLLPAIAPTFARVQRSKGLRPIGRCVAFGAAGLSTYLYLPMRAAAGASLNLGDPTNWQRFYWVVSAQAFQGTHSTGLQPLPARFADVLVQLVDNLHPVPRFMALAGAYALLRPRGMRRIGTIWVLVLVCFVGARAWLGFVRSNPDALGYLMPAFGAVGALAAAFVAAVLVSFGRAGEVVPGRTAVVVSVVLAAFGLAQIQHSVEGASLARFSAVDDFEQIGRRTLPARAVVIAYNPQTIFRMWGAEAAEEMRPDVTVVAMPFLNYPGFVNALADTEPALEDVLRGRVMSGALQEGDLQSLAARRPVMVELDPRLGPNLYRTLIPHGLFHEVLPDRTYEDDREQGALRAAAAYELLDRLVDDGRDELETSHQLLWFLYHQALYYAANGHWARAQKALGAARSINPLATELIGLEAAVAVAAEDEDTSELDVTPFLLMPP
ncbi:MAG: DUF2723 domain-containing protein [Deltaproteobacteria bacterium]|nr:DUF2723 domain-containing protein [Deltaproteobacteria bacterium]